MDFHLTEEQKMLKQMVHELTENEFRPRAAYWDEHAEFPWENIRKLGAYGLFGIIVPEEYGGLGQTIFEVVLTIEEIARVCRNTSTMLVTQTGDEGDILEHGSDDLKRRLLPPMAKGEKLGVICISEPDAGSDLSPLRTLAEPDGDHFIVNGMKHFITNGRIADIFVTFVRYYKESKGNNGIGSMVIEKELGGIEFGKDDHTMGIRGCNHPEVLFRDCHVPRGNVLIMGEPENANGLRKALNAFNRERCFNAANSLGTAQGAFEEAVKYAEQRVQFGRPVAEFQGIQWMLADMLVKIEAGRWLLYRATQNAGRGTPDRLEAAIAKTYLNEAALEVVNLAMQVHGAYGYTTEFPIERAARDVRLYSFGAGTTQVQRNLIASEIRKGNHSRIIGR